VRGFLTVAGLLTGGIVLAFAIALATAKDPVDRLPPQLVAGAELTGAPAQEAFETWLGALPLDPALPLHIKLELADLSELSDNSAPAGHYEMSMDLAMADLSRGRAEVSLKIQEPGRPLVQGQGVLLADGKTMWLWGAMDEFAGQSKREGAFSVKQSLVEDAWVGLRARLPDLLRMAEIEGVSNQIAPPSSVLLLLHPAWMTRSLASWPCTSLKLDDAGLHARFQFNEGDAALDLLATFDVNSGQLTQVDAAGLSGAARRLRITVTTLDASLPDSHFTAPADLKATDVSPMAQMALGMLNGALSAMGGASNTEF
jgi:hypothetical protein